MQTAKKQNLDLFGNPVIEDELLRDRFIEPPFSVLDTKSGSWRERKKKWLRLGIQSEIGRDAICYNIGDKETFEQQTSSKRYSVNAHLPEKEQRALGCYAAFGGNTIDRNTGGKTGTSIFDPALCELLYYWFCPEKGNILDPFAGGSVRGIVAHYLGYFYTGIDLSNRQIESNRKQAIDILGVDNMPNWYVGDSLKLLDNFTTEFDFLFSCPPYHDLEIYSDSKEDLSNMNYHDFIIAYRNIIYKSCRLLKPDGFACFVVGEIRDSNGNYKGFVPDTIRAFIDAGMNYYNEAILLTPIGTAMIRANNNMKSKKLVKVHQNVLVFKK